MITSTTTSVIRDRVPRSHISHKRNWLARIAMCLALIGCLMTAAPAKAYPPAIPANVASNSITPKMDAEIDKHFKQKRLPGLVVLYARDGLLTYKRTLGYSDVENQVKMTEHRIGRLNSVSKLVAGVISMQQVEKGNFNLNTKASDYLPDLPAHHTYRVKDLLACRSGVRHYGEPASPSSPQNFAYGHYNSATAAAPKIWNDPLAAPVGWYHYSTHGYTLLGACLEQAAHKSISDIIKTDLTQKYGLTTLAAEDVTKSNSQRMQLYHFKKKEHRIYVGSNELVNRDDPSWKVLGGGIESSPLDLLKFGILLGDGKIISKSSLDLMMKRIDPLESYALGCTSSVENGYHVMSKSGSFEGSNAYMWLVPEERMVMVIMANRDEADVSGLAGKLRNIIVNTSNAASTKPDLIVKNFAKTGTPQFKNGNWEIPVRFDVKNQGGAGVNNSFVNGILLGTKYRWSGFMDAMPKGATDKTTAVVKIPDAGKLMAGRKVELVAFADAPIAAADTSMPKYGRVDERASLYTGDYDPNEVNNKATLSVTLPGGLGIGLTGQKPQEPAFPGASNPQRVPPANRPPRRIGGRLIREPQAPQRVPVVVPQATFDPPSRPSAPPKRVQIAVPKATFVPPSRPSAPPARVPAVNLPGRRPAVLGHGDLVIRSIRFVPNRPQMVYVVVGNAGQGPARASVLRLTVRKIGNSSVGRTTDVKVPALKSGESKVLTVDASSILPNRVALKSTTFRVDADITKVVAESNETNNLEWHMP